MDVAPLSLFDFIGWGGTYCLGTLCAYYSHFLQSFVYPDVVCARILVLGFFSNKISHCLKK